MDKRRCVEETAPAWLRRTIREPGFAGILEPEFSKRFQGWYPLRAGAGLVPVSYTHLDVYKRQGHESIDITYRYAHLFPTRQTEMADQLDFERMGT